MIEAGSPVRVRLVDGSNHAGVVVDMDEYDLTVQCMYKYIPVSEQEGMSDQVVEVMNGMTIQELLMIALELEVLKKCGRGFVIGGRRGLTTVLSGAMMDSMEDVLIAQQSPVTKVFPRESLIEISSLYDEGQEKLFEKWASG